MSYEYGRVDLTPRRYHGYAVILFILGTLLPPLAVAARFGIGKDFWLNVVLTLCGYIPGHFHNFYIQNVRNNKNHRRTPKWAQKYGLVDTTKIQRDARKRQWATRFNERLPHSTLEGQQYAEGEIPDSASRQDSILDPDARRREENRYWNENDERYYGQRSGARRSNASLDSGSGSTGRSGGGRWHYPANFEDTLPSLENGHANGRKKKKVKKDRWARTEDAYNAPPPSSGTKKRKMKKTKNHSTVGGANADGMEHDRRSSATSLDGTNFPEDPEGGLYGERTTANGTVPEIPSVDARGRPRGELEHEF